MSSMLLHTCKYRMFLIVPIFVGANTGCVCVIVPMCRVGQNRTYTYIYTVYLVISKPKIPYVHCIYIVLANPIYVCDCTCVWGYLWLCLSLWVQVQSVYVWLYLCAYACDCTYVCEGVCDCAYLCGCKFRVCMCDCTYVIISTTQDLHCQHKACTAKLRKHYDRTQSTRAAPRLTPKHWPKYSPSAALNCCSCASDIPKTLLEGPHSFIVAEFAKSEKVLS